MLVFAGSDLVERGFGYPKASTQHSKTPPKGLVAISQPSSLNFLVFSSISLLLLLACSGSHLWEEKGTAPSHV
jgi:hypothetical protein